MGATIFHYMNRFVKFTLKGDIFRSKLHDYTDMYWRSKCDDRSWTKFVKRDDHRDVLKCADLRVLTIKRFNFFAAINCDLKVNSNIDN